MSTKRFLLVFFIVYIGISAVWYTLYGPASLSRAYLDKNFEIHEHYLEILHSEHFQRYLELRHIYRKTPGEEYPRTDDEALNKQIAFVQAYENNPEYIAEQKRIAKFHYFFEFFSAAGGLFLALWFGWKPFMGFLDNQITLIKGRIERAETERRQAAQAKANSHSKLAGLDAEKADISAHTKEMIQRTQAEAREASAQLAAQIDQEAAAREAAERLRAAMAIKRELVEAAVKRAAENFEQAATPADHKRLVDDFVTSVERLS